MGPIQSSLNLLGGALTGLATTALKKPEQPKSNGTYAVPQAQPINKIQIATMNAFTTHDEIVKSKAEQKLVLKILEQVS